MWWQLTSYLRTPSTVMRFWALATSQNSSSSVLEDDNVIILLKWLVGPSFNVMIAIACDICAKYVLIGARKML